MKQFHTLIAASIFSAGVLAFISFTPPRMNSSSTPRSEGEEASGYLQYELKRLRNPATGKIPANIRQLELQYAATLTGYLSPSSLSLSRKGNGEEVLSTVPWQSRGPWNVGGRTRAFAMDATNPAHLIAGSTAGGIWQSADTGASWTQNWNFVHQSISCLAQDTRKGKTNTWYAGSGEGYGQSASGGNAYYLGNGMFKSTDGGTTWSSLASTAQNQPQTFSNVWDIIWNVAPNAADTVNDVVYAAVYNTIYKSVNGGTSWTVARGGGLTAPYSYFTDVAVSKTGVVYCTLSSDGGAGWRGIWRSPDGNTWTNITPSVFASSDSFPANYGRIKIGISPKDENQVYFWGSVTSGNNCTCQCDTNFLGDIECNSLWKYNYISGNGSGIGGMWHNFSPNLPTTGGPHDKQYTQGGYDMYVKVHPTDTNVVFLGGTNIYRSDTGFYSPSKTTFMGGYLQFSAPPNTDTYLNHHPDQHELFFDTTGNKFTVYSSNDGGLYKSTNAMASTVAWTKLNNGYLTSMFYTVALDHIATGDSTLIGGLQDNNSYFVNSLNPKQPWVKEFFGDGSYCAIDYGKNNYYFSIQSGRIKKFSLDAAGNVLGYRRMDPIGGKGYQFINPFVLDPNNQNRMYLAGGKHLWRNDSLNIIPLTNQNDSINTGWTMFPDTVPTTNSTITAVSVSKNPASIVYYGTDNKRVYRVDNADIGTPTPKDITGTGFPGSAYVTSIAIDPDSANKVLVAFSNYSVQSIFYSSNATSATPTWKAVGGNLEPGNGTGPSVRWVSIMPVSNGTVYLAATSTGVYATDTLMGTSTVWVQQGAASIGNSICDMIDYRTTDGLVAVATHSRGIFTTHITQRSDIGVVSVWASHADASVCTTPCNGTATATATGGNGNYTYTWYQGVNSIGAGATITGLCPNTYSVVVQDNAAPNPNFGGTSVSIVCVAGVNEYLLNGTMNIYPNPFTASTTLRFTLSKTERVKLSVYDVHGNLIETLADKELSSGEHRFEFNGEKLSAGIYYCTLRAGEARETKKLVLLR